MLSSPSILSTLLYNHNVANLKILFVQEFDFQKTDHNMINKYLINKIN